jgi:hypothetical protein
MFRMVVVAVAVLVLSAGSARADEPPPIPVTKVELQERPDFAKSGKVAVYKGEADDKGVAFYIDGLSISTPVGILLLSGDAAAPMRLSVKNDLSPKWDRELKPEGALVKTQFTTEGPAMALVRSSSSERKPYTIVIWVGHEIPLHKLMAAPFVTQAKYDAKHGAVGSSSSTTVVVVVAVVVVLGLLLVIAIRRKKGATR